MPSSKSTNVRELLNEARRQFSAGHLLEARDLLNKIVDLNSDLPDVYLGLAAIEKKDGEFEAALQQIEKALRLDSQNISHLHMKGEILVAIDDIEAALRSYSAAYELDPQSFITLMNLGDIYTKLERHQDASKLFHEAVAIRPDSLEAVENLAFSLMRSGESDAALDYFEVSANLYLGQAKIPSQVTRIAGSRLIHDHEQIQYLAAAELLDSDYASYAESLKRIAVKNAKPLSSETNHSVSLSPQELGTILPSFNRIVYRSKADRLSGPAVNPDLNFEEIQNAFNSETPEVIFIDNILTPEALESLYQFCLESTVFKRTYGSGYVGAILAEGFASPLLLQLAEELRFRFPGIFRDLPLNQAWAYKYDSMLSGIKEHADFASVNFNMWISPDKGNLDEESGGLIVWDKECPEDWSFRDFNQNISKIQKFLEATQAKPIKIPFRRNRAVIFNSTLFHKTDDIHFADRYEDRRINLTLLYGMGMKFAR